MVTFTCNKNSVEIEGEADENELAKNAMLIAISVAIQNEKDTDGKMKAQDTLLSLAGTLLAASRDLEKLSPNIMDLKEGRVQ